VTVDLLPEVALGAAGVMRAALDRSTSQVASAPTVAALLRQSSLVLDFIRTYHDSLAAELDRKGLDPDVLLYACRVSLETLDGIAESRRLLAKLLADEEQKAEYLRQEELAAALRLTVMQGREGLDRPVPPVDLKKLEEETRADVEAGRMIRLEKVEDLFPSHADDA
jgi:hypothetical protein